MNLLRMYSLKEINEFVKDNHLLEDHEEEEITKHIQIILSKKSKEDFIHELRQVYTYQFNHFVEIIYDFIILSEEDGSKKWDKFFVEEFERAFRMTEKNYLTGNLYNLSGICYCLGDHIQSRKEIVKICSKYLRSKNDKISMFAIEYIEESLELLENRSSFYPVMQDLRTMLKDKNRKIRLRVYETLLELSYLPSDFKLSLVDRFFWWRIERKNLKWKKKFANMKFT